MRYSKFFIPTSREVPKDAEALSHKLMVKGGYVKKLSSGVYTYLPLGFLVLKNVMDIVREEMNNAGAIELMMPALHPVDIWKKTGRYETMKDIVMPIGAKGDEILILGPTHEEIITDIVASYINSYKQLPVILYQIQTKFRDEARPRFGIIRSKEFIMKDAYSFDTSFENSDKSYEKMYEAYKRIFSRCGLEFTIVSADTGDMGGDVSHEFMVLLPFGEDVVAKCENCGMLESLEVAKCPLGDCGDNIEFDCCPPVEEVYTPGKRSIEELKEFFGADGDRFIKTMIYESDGEIYAVLVRGGDEVCEPKLKSVLGVYGLKLASDKVIEDVTSAPVGYAGPVGLKEGVRIVADNSLKNCSGMITGANKKDYHIKNVVAGRDFNVDIFGDIRYLREDDKCYKCGSDVSLEKALEVGHVFKLGTKYSSVLGAAFLDESGKSRDIVMGCYGIGVNRIVAAALELNSNEKEVVWPLSIAPFEIEILPLDVKDEDVMGIAEELYGKLLKDGVRVLIDDRDKRAGVKFNDAELIGSPYTVVIGSRGLKAEVVELRDRRYKKADTVPAGKIYDVVKEVLNGNVER